MSRTKPSIAALALALAVALAPAAQAAAQAPNTQTVHVAKKHTKVRAHASAMVCRARTGC